jgi:hyperosmotically inducible protein
MNSNNKIFSPGIVLIIVLAIGGCDKMDKKEAVHEELALAVETTVGTEIDDSVITTKVKSALLTDPDIKIFDIKVETRKGEVLLSGFVNSKAQIDQAIVVAQGVDGVRKVTNKMDLKVMDTTVGNKIDDAVITTKVKSSLLAAKDIKSTDVSVVTREGVVQLGGFVNSQTQVDRVIEVTRGVEGVQSTLNEMSIKK